MLTDEEIMNALTSDDKKYINQTLEESMEEKPYQITYMHGPLNITLRLNKREKLVEELELTLQEARDSDILNAKASVSDSNAPKSNDKVIGGVKAKCKQCGAEMVHKSGTSKKGKPWEGLFCPVDRDHEPVWL